MTSFRVNQIHPIIKQLHASLNEQQLQLFNLFYKGLETYLPLQVIQAQMQSKPHSLNQTTLNSDEIEEIIALLKVQGIDEDWIEHLKLIELLK